MPVKIELSENKHYIIYQMSNPINMDELMGAYDKEREFRDSQPHTMHSIIDMSALTSIPPRWLTAKAGPGFTHPRSGNMLFVGVSQGLSIVLRTVMKIVNYDRMQFFDTMDEAEAAMTKLLETESGVSAS